jgi:hypothetical protein
MAINFLNSVDFNKNELLNPTIENQPNDAAAGTGVEGQLYFNTTNNVLKVYDGSSWVEVGGGVISLTTNNGTYVNLTDSGTAADPVITADLSAVDGTAAAGERYLTKTNKWATVASIPGTTYDLTGAVSNTTDFAISLSGSDASLDKVILKATNYITLTDGGSNDVIITHANTSRTDTTSTDAPAFGGTFTAVQSVTTNSTGHVTAIDVSTVTLPTPAASDNYQYWVLSDGTNSTNITSTGTATFQGTSGEIGVTESSGTVTIGLRDNVTIPNNLTVTNTLDMTNGQINNLANGTASTDAVNLGQVQGLIAGTGQFQGGYDATNDPGSPAISGSSNVALDTGDFYVVTVDGDITFSDQTISVEVGDLIFANTDIAANSNPASTDYTFVIQDQNIAGEGATDSATEKGVAGFNSAFFSVTANGFVSADYATASTAGVNYIAAGTGLTATYGASGRITISKDNTNQSAKRLSLNSAVNGITRAEAGGVTTFTLDVTDSNLFGTGADPLDVMCEVLGNAVNAGDTVYASIERSGSNLLVKFTGSVANADYQILLNYVA